MINNILNIPVNLGAGVDVWVKTHSELLSLIPPQADGAGGGGKCTVSLHQHLRRNPCHLIQRYEHYDNTISMMCSNFAAFKKQYQNKRRLKKIHTSFQPVDVLRVHPEKLTLLVEQSYEIMGQIGLIVPWIQLFGQGEEGIRVLMKKADFEYGLGIGKVILLQVVVEAATWRPVREICD